MRLRALLLTGLTAACGAHRPPPAAAVEHHDVASAVRSWERWDLPLEGLSAAFPAKPDQYVSRKDTENGPLVTSSLVAIESEHGFTLSHTTRGGKDRPRDVDWIAAIRKTFKKAERIEEFELGDFRGVMVWQTDKDKQFASWHLLVGDGYVSAVVTAPPAKFDEARARQFFDSLRFELPWRIYAAPVGRLSIAVPATAVEVSAADLDYAADGPSRAFFVGGKSEVMYLIGSMELAADMEAQGDDAILGGTLHGIAARGTDMLWQEPIRFDEASALDYLGKFKNFFIRGRLLRVGHYLYALQIQSTSRKAVGDDSAERFLESLRWY